MDAHHDTTTAYRPAPLELLTFSGLLHTLQTVALAALVFVVYAGIPKIRYRMRTAKLPTFVAARDGEKLRPVYLMTAKQMYIEGYKKFKDSVYIMTNLDGEDTIVVPPSLLPELRKLGDDVLSFPKAVERLLEVKYTKLENEAELSSHAIKSDLTPALARLNPTICAEVDIALEQYLPPCTDWTEVNINGKLIEIVARVSGRVFVGPDLSQNPEYLDCAANYTIYLVAAIRAIKKVRPVFRPLLVPRLPEIRRLRAMEKKAVDYHKPIVRARMAAAKNDPNWQQPDDMLQWLLKRGKEHGFTSVERLAKAQLGLIFAAIHTTSMTATNILYTLAVTPEYIEPLREEIRYVMSQNGGEITTRALQGMEKMDSYMKEVTRVYTPGITSFTRRVLKPITLSNAQHIPAGAMLEVPSAAVYSDATHYPDSASFDGFRHYKLRRSGTAVDHARNQFVTSNETNLGFGYGRHACPGRFFAANEIKMIVAKLVMKYDIKMPGGRRERWENIEMGRGSVPDGGKAVLMRKAEG